MLYMIITAYNIELHVTKYIPYILCLKTPCAYFCISHQGQYNIASETFH